MIQFVYIFLSQGTNKIIKQIIQNPFLVIVNDEAFHNSGACPEQFYLWIKPIWFKFNTKWRINFPQNIILIKKIKCEIICIYKKYFTRIESL